MTELRRTMSQALQPVDLSPQALALIREGVPKSRRVSEPTPHIVRPEPPSLETSGVQLVRADPVPVTTPAPVPHKPVREAPSRAKASSAPPSPHPHLPSTVSMTVRVPGDLASRLLRAAMDRKLGRLSPWTQQAMVTEAIAHWLRQNGY